MYQTFNTPVPIVPEVMMSMPPVIVRPLGREITCEPVVVKVFMYNTFAVPALFWMVTTQDVGPPLTAINICAKENVAVSGVVVVLVVILTTGASCDWSMLRNQFSVNAVDG